LLTPPWRTKVVFNSRQAIGSIGFFAVSTGDHLHHRGGHTFFEAVTKGLLGRIHVDQGVAYQGHLEVDVKPVGAIVNKIDVNRCEQLMKDFLPALSLELSV
jgi:hypothetical protein